jgi:hypothetical protein
MRSVLLNAGFMPLFIMWVFRRLVGESGVEKAPFVSFDVSKAAGM